MQTNVYQDIGKIYNFKPLKLFSKSAKPEPKNKIIEKALSLIADYKKRHSGLTEYHCYFDRGRILLKINSEIYIVEKRKFSEETKRKMSEAHKGQVAWNKGTKGIMKGWNKGRKLSAELRQKLSEAHKKIGNGRLGTKLSDETKKKISQKMKGRIPWNKGKPRSEETKRKISETKRKKNKN